MAIKDIVFRVQNSRAYKKWQPKNPGFYLVHVFFMSEQPIQVGYYNKELDKITTFEIGKSEVKVNPVSDVFKEKGSIVQLEMDKIKIDRQRALDIFSDMKKENYDSAKLSKEIMILQEHQGTIIYNTTFFTTDFKTINCKIDATNGEVLGHDMNSLVSF